MNTEIQQTTEPTPNPEIRDKILEIMDKKHGAFWGEFYTALIPPYEVEAVRLALKSLVNDGTLRMKEDDQEHDWEYLRCRLNRDTPTTPGYADHMRARNRREGIEPEPYRAPLKIAGFVTPGWLESQARDAEANGHALVEKGLACAADAWFALSKAYRAEVDVLFSDNA